MSAAPKSVSSSPFANTAATYAERGLAIMPCGPGTKFPGRITPSGWAAAHDWQRYCDRLPTQAELDEWEAWPDAGVCLALGRSSAPAGLQLVAVDIDTEEPAEVAAIRSCLPGSPVRKRGAKGETEFYLAAISVPNRPYNNTLNVDHTGKRTKIRMLDLLGHGRQTVLPGSIHPGTGKPYFWTTLDTLENFDVADLPRLPDDIADRLSAALAPFGHEDHVTAGPADPNAEATTHRTLNNAAMANLPAWIPALNLYKCRQFGGKYKAVASWRPSASGRPEHKRATNLAIQPSVEGIGGGIKDCGEGRTYTPLDLVMAACECDLEMAFRWLQERVAPAEPVVLSTKARATVWPDHDDEPCIRRTSPKGNLSFLRLATEDGARVDDEPEGVEAESIDAQARRFVNELNGRGEPKARALAAALNRELLGINRQAGRIDPPPVDLWQRYEAPEMPLACLPPVIADFASSQAVLMGADIAGIGMSALAVCAAAITDDIQIQVKQHDDGWLESARLWVGLIGMPSTKKTPMMNAAMRPLRHIDKTMAEQNSSLDAAYWQLPKKARDETPPPRQPRRVVEDATIEALQGVLKDSPHGVLSMQDELSGWFGAMERYNGGGKAAAADRGFWLKAFNGGSLSVNRVGRGAVYIPNLSIGVLGGIQPEPLRKIIGDTYDDGLIQRFLPVMLKSATVGCDLPAGDSTTAYGTLVEALTCLSPPRGTGNLARAQALRFSQAARAVRERIEAENVEMVRALEVISPKLAAHIGKHDGLFARLCLLWHCIEHAKEAAPPAEITEATASQVAQFFVDFIRPSAVAFYAGLLGMSAGHEDLMAVASLIVSDGLDEVCARDLRRSRNETRHVDADMARRVFEKLEAFGWLDSVAPQGKRTAPRWRVVPAVHELFAERGRIEAARVAKNRAAYAEMMSRRA